MNLQSIAVILIYQRRNKTPSGVGFLQSPASVCRDQDLSCLHSRPFWSPPRTQPPDLGLERARPNGLRTPGGSSGELLAAHLPSPGPVSISVVIHTCSLAVWEVRRLQPVSLKSRWGRAGSFCAPRDNPFLCLFQLQVATYACGLFLHLHSTSPSLCFRHHRSPPTLSPSLL